MELKVYDPHTQSLSDCCAIAPCNAQAALMQKICEEAGGSLQSRIVANNIGLDQKGRSDLGATYPIFDSMTVERAQGLEHAYAVVMTVRSRLASDSLLSQTRYPVREGKATTKGSREIRVRSQETKGNQIARFGQTRSR